MIKDINTQLWFGKYKGHTIREVYQGTLNYDSRIFSYYLQHIFNCGIARIPTDSDYLYPINGSDRKGKLIFGKEPASLAPGFLQINHLDSISVCERFIRLCGKYNPDLSSNVGDDLVIGNVQGVLENFVNDHLNDNSSIGALDNFKNFRKILETTYPKLCDEINCYIVPGDMSYLLWSERNISNFLLDSQCKTELEDLPVVKITGIRLLYIGNETYEYKLLFETHYRKFPNKKTNFS